MKKEMESWIFPDKLEEVEPGIKAVWLLYGFESALGLFPIGCCHLRENHDQVVAQKLAAARGHSAGGVTVASQRSKQQIDRGTR